MNSFSNLSDLDGEEFDFIVELVIVAIFMAVCIFGTVSTVYALSKRIEYTPRVDKVQYTANSMKENNPYEFTGYQAYMIAWHMDGLDDNTIIWTAGDNYTETAVSDESGIETKLAAVIDPVEHRAGFITYRNQIITNTRLGEGKSVSKMLKDISTDVGIDLVSLYRGFDVEKFDMKLTEYHVTTGSDLYDYSGVIEDKGRKINKWTICYQGKCTH